MANQSQTTTTTTEPETTTTTTEPETTTTTTEEQTTTTTTQEPETTTTTTVTAPEDKKGEVVIDEDAEAKQLKEQPAEQRLTDARNEGLANHAAEHADDVGDVTGRDAD